MSYQRPIERERWHVSAVTPHRPTLIDVVAQLGQEEERHPFTVAGGR